MWLINTHNGVKEKGVNPIDINDYPAIKKHLDQYLLQLEKRLDKGDTIYNLRNCAYIEDFSKQKLVWKRIGSILRFSLDETGCISLDSTCFAVGKSIKYLTAFFNSNVGNYILKDSPKTGTGDLLISVQAFDNITIPKIDSVLEEKIDALIDEIKRLDNEKEILKIGKHLDQMFYDLYDFNSDELAELKNINLS